MLINNLVNIIFIFIICILIVINIITQPKKKNIYSDEDLKDSCIEIYGDNYEYNFKNKKCQPIDFNLECKLDFGPDYEYDTKNKKCKLIDKNKKCKSEFNDNYVYDKIKKCIDASEKKITEKIKPTIIPSKEPNFLLNEFKCKNNNDCNNSGECLNVKCIFNSNSVGDKCNKNLSFNVDCGK